uniref:Ig-like domain-containing protein n=1 Tax=Felis catus TaxID=9685 RepID=A0ABI7XVF8_FELCA
MTEAPRVDTSRRRPPAPVCPAVMLCLLLPLALVSCLGPGNTASQASSTPLMVNGTLEESVTFPLKLLISEDTHSITWLYNGTSITFIQLSDPSDPRIILTNPKWKDRLRFSRNYSLQLSNLTMADAGSYHAQITTQTSTVFSSYKLRIFRPLRNLEVANHTWRSENGTCEIHLTCSVENMNDDNLVRWEVAGSISIREANLTLSWDPKNSSEKKYTCIAENPVSQLSFSVSTQSLCKDFLNDESIGTLWIALVTVILICPVIVLLVVWRKKYCLCKRGKGREEGPLGRPLGCDRTRANFLQKMHDQASRPGCPSPSSLPAPHPLERHLWARGRAWGPLTLHSQISISLILFFRHLSFLCSANPDFW